MKLVSSNEKQLSFVMLTLNGSLDSDQNKRYSSYGFLYILVFSTEFVEKFWGLNAFILSFSSKPWTDEALSFWSNRLKIRVFFEQNRFFSSKQSPAFPIFLMGLNFNSDDNIKVPSFVSAWPASNLKSKSGLCCLFITASLIFTMHFIGGLDVTEGFKEMLLGWQAVDLEHNPETSRCQNQNRPRGTEALPEGIVVRTSDLDMQPLWSVGLTNMNTNTSKGLLAMAVGIKQKEIVDKIVRKFPPSDFTVMLFHYDGVVDEWKDLSRNDEVIHISAENQNKWWFAKRFLHPDIVAEYEYIFLWDEDLGVENFNPRRYISIIKEEGLEISQPALDLAKSAINHKITIRFPKSRVHRKAYDFRRRRWCVSDAPPCTGWVEMMAPVFSRAAWRCAWYMIQNDLSHAWGLVMKLGYCAKGDRTKKVGVVDEEYIVHLGLPTLGGKAENEQNVSKRSSSQQEQFTDAEVRAPTETPNIWSARQMVRRQSFKEMRIFNKRWERAVKKDSCWIDPYKNPSVLPVL